ncbi:MAG TPA: hypothetical protein VFS00_31045, partial [Polyangiaceae bacterium]|nr:hypothetical protein [Polyangiaceae bacterium]
MRHLAGRRLRNAVALFGAAVVASHLLGRAHEGPWDDAYFFKRIARNFVEHGALAWNVSEGPVYGNTSLGFQVLAVALAFLSPGHYFAWLKLVSAGLELALLRLYLKAAPPAGREPAAAPARVALDAAPPAGREPAGTLPDAAAARALPDAAA